MSGPIVSFDVKLTDPAARARQLLEAYYRAYSAALDEARAAGIIVHGDSLQSKAYHAGRQFGDFWERRAKRVERVFRWLLASDQLTDEQRAEIVEVLHGRQLTGRDPKLLTDAEQQLLTHYRATDNDGKAMMRTLMARLAGEPWAKQHNRRHRERSEGRNAHDDEPQNIGKPVIDLTSDDREGA